MFIDEKIREYIAHEKNGWQEVRKIWEEIRSLISRQKELDNYLATYTNDSLHQQMKEYFDKVLDNIESLANTFNLKVGIEIAVFSAFLIHNGYLSITGEYSYKEILFDIKKNHADKTLNTALKIFNGIGNCRHTAAFIKKVLDRFNIENNIVAVDGDSIDYNINEIRLFLQNYHKTISANTNHVINYISENDYNYFLSLDSIQPRIFGAYNQFAYLLDGCYNLVFPLYSYNYSIWSDEFIDYRKVPSLSKEKADELIDTANATIRKCKANIGLLVEFYLQNIDNYHRISENYNKVYEKEKALSLIARDK